MRPVSEEEALSFPGKWKVRHAGCCARSNSADIALVQIPAVLFYERRDAPQLLDFSKLPLHSDPSILCEDITISK